MIGRDELTQFKKMWIWLCGYPAHDREYYMKNVAKLGKEWINSCPLYNKTEEKECDGCKELWDSEKSTLCTDPHSPLYKWNITARHFTSDRSFYASKTAVLAMRFLQRQRTEGRVIVRRHFG